MAMSDINFDPCILLKFLIGYIICLGYKYMKLNANRLLHCVNSNLSFL